MFTPPEGGAVDTDEKVTPALMFSGSEMGTVAQMSVKVSLNRYFICVNHQTPPLASASRLCSYGFRRLESQLPGVGNSRSSPRICCEMKGSGAEEAKKKKKKKKIKMFFCLSGRRKHSIVHLKL